MRRAHATGWITGACVLGLVAGVVWIGRGESRPVAPSSRAPAVDDYSNIRAADYVGPDRCAECHKKRYRQWRGNLHRSMNRLSSAGAILGDFADVRLRYAGGEARFHRRGDDYVMSLRRDGQPTRRFRITRTIGSRYLQEYVGVLESGPEPPGHMLYTTETRLPFGYWLRKRAWFHQQYFDSWYGAEYAADGTPSVDAYAPTREPWATRCAWCHNTYPFEIRALRSDRNRIGHGPAQFFTQTRHGVGAAAAKAVVDQNRLPIESLVTVGISCESCHLGGREHADHERDISFVPRSPDLTRRPRSPDLRGGRDNNVVINAVCGQCHSTPAPAYPDGGATRASREALDLAAGACISAIKCTDCHDPHVKGPGGGALAQRKHIAACVGCHDTYASSNARAKHTRHSPSVSCLDCHMPKRVQGLSHVIRSHRISSPSDPKMLGAGAPNACNLCHLDKPIRWTLHALEDGWDRHIPPLVAWQNHYGRDLAAPAGDAWLASDEPAYRVAAAAAFARGPATTAVLDKLLDRLDDPIAHYRMWMLFAIEDLVGRPLTVTEYDPRAAPGVRANQVRRLRTALRPRRARAATTPRR